jgi:hypothetical protein
VAGNRAVAALLGREQRAPSAPPSRLAPGGPEARAWIVDRSSVPAQSLAASATVSDGPVVQRAPKTRPIPQSYSHVSVHSLGIKSGERGQGDDVANSGEFKDGASALLDAAAAVLKKKRSKVPELKLRLKALAMKVAEADAEMQAQQATVNGQVLGVFTAPEWFFKRPDEPFSEGDKDTIKKTVQQLSYAAPNLLIVPGSVVWGSIKKGLHNTTFAYLNGHLLREIDKRLNAGDTATYKDKAGTERAAKAAYTTGQGRSTPEMGGEAQGSSFFSVGDVNVSLEICADHGRALSEQTKSRAAPQHGVDVQILISHSAMPAIGRQVVAPGGIVIHNDAVGGMRSVTQNTGAGVARGGMFYPAAGQSLNATSAGTAVGQLVNVDAVDLGSGRASRTKLWLAGAAENVEQMGETWSEDRAKLKKQSGNDEEIAVLKAALRIQDAGYEALEQLMAEDAPAAASAARVVDHIISGLRRLKSARIDGWCQLLDRHAAALHSMEQFEL